MMKWEAGRQTIGWFRETFQNGRLTIKPPYQRKPVWVAKQKCYLIESILEGMPVPEIYLQVATDENGVTSYAVVDGQQRMRTVFQFIGIENDPHEQEHNKFLLDKLPGTSPWRNKSFADLSPDQKRTFFSYTFATRDLHTNEDNDVRAMFIRLNKYLSPLKPQELRNATYTGPFAKLAENLADDTYWSENKIVTPAAIRRMADIEFVAELLIGTMHGPQGGSAATIDEYYQQYEEYEDEFPEQKMTERLYNETLRYMRKLFPTIKGARWSNKTDFYTLFVALAFLLHDHKLPEKNLEPMRKALGRFETDIDKRFKDESAKVTQAAQDYVRAVEKGANERTRRAARHDAMLTMVQRFFVPKAGAGAAE